MTAELLVDLDALASNLRRVREVVGPAETMLVVKDDAYRHGLLPVVRRAAREGVRWFGAFDVSTGRAVREELGADVRVFVWMTASPSETAESVALRLDLGVGDAEVLEEAAEGARRAGVPARVHLKIDTGLHRNGVRPEEWGGFVARSAALQREGLVEVVGVWSHIAEASDEEDDASRAVFETALQTAAEAGLTPTVRHLAASAASFARPEFRYDLVRVGAFSYGVRSAGGPSADALGIRPIARLRAEVVEVGERVAIDLTPFDGIPSVVADRIDVGTPAGPRRLRTLGRETLVDGWDSAARGDVVTVFGPGADGESGPTEIAEAIETIGEEILLRLSPRIVRRYIGGA